MAWIVSYFSDDFLSVAEPNGQIVEALAPGETLEDALNVVRSHTEGRVDVKFFDRDAYETLETT